MHFFLRFLLFVGGMAAMSLGVVLVIKADLGTSPISTLPYVASLGFSYSIGFYTILVNTGLVALQVLLLRKKFPRVQYLQIFVSILFGVFLDFWMAELPNIDLPTYGHKWLFLVTGTLITSLGVFMVIKANLLVMAGEGLVIALSLVTNRKLGTLKVAVDVTLALAGALLSVLLFQDIKGVREGTVFAALFTGIFLKGFFAIADRKKKILPTKVL